MQVKSSVRNGYLHVNGDVGPNELAASNRKLVSSKHEQVISRNIGNLQKNRVTPYIACTRLNLVGAKFTFNVLIYLCLKSCRCPVYRAANNNLITLHAICFDWFKDCAIQLRYILTRL